MALAITPAAAQTRIDQPTGDWVHSATGTRFPASLPPFNRGNITEYTSDGRDASVSYRLIRGDVLLLVTLYIYPARPGDSCQAHFDGLKAEVTNGTKTAEMISESRADSPSGKTRGAGYRARFHYPAGAMGPGLGELTSDAYLFCPKGGQWLVVYRATWSAKVDFSADVDQVVRAIAWPTPLGE